MELEIQTPRWFRPLLDPSLRYLGARGGRGSGKSVAFAELAIERSLMERFDLVCVREVQKSLQQSVHKLLAGTIERLNAGAYFEVLDAVIRGPHGNRIIFQGMATTNAESIKSLDGFHAAWVEEAQTLSQRSLDMLRPTIRAPGSQIWFSWNPRQATDPVEAFMCGETSPPNSRVVHVNWDSNPWFPDVLREEMEWDLKNDPGKWAHIWKGEYLQMTEARVFKNWRIEEFERPTGTIFRLGADFGYSIDPSCLIRCSMDGRALYIDYEAWQLGCEIVNLPELFMSVPEAEKWPLAADSSRPETISHLRSHGFPKIAASVKGPGSVEEGIAWLQSMEIIVHPRCQHVIDELSTYCYKTDPLTGAVLPILADKNNHCIDAIRYGMEGARRAQKANKPTAPIIQRTFVPPSDGWML